MGGLKWEFTGLLHSAGNVEPDEDLHVPRMSLLEIDEEGTPFTSEEEVPAPCFCAFVGWDVVYEVLH